MKFGWEEYWKPTPKNIRKFADSVIVACVFSGGYATMNDNPTLSTTIFILGFVFKIISNFFSETPTNE
jgi:hypothetical protein